jgi:phosphopantetheinyl transferase
VTERRQVGIDVETIAPREDLLALAERALAPADAAAVRAADPGRRPQVFYAAWVRHEARLKCLGTGLGAPAPATRTAVESVDAGPSYAAAVAVADSEVGPLHCRTLRAG